LKIVERRNEVPPSLSLPLLKEDMKSLSLSLSFSPSEPSVSRREGKKKVIKSERKIMAATEIELLTS
jgi:hypothetical protein